MEALAPLSNLQLELLQLYNNDIDQNDLIAIKKLISAYFASKAITLADEMWDKEGWSEKKMEEFLNTKMRTRYNKSSL